MLTALPGEALEVCDFPPASRGGELLPSSVRT